MLRFLVGYLIGAVIGFLLSVSFVYFKVSNDAISFVFFSVLFVVIFVIGLVWSYKHHIRMKKEYYKKINS